MMNSQQQQQQERERQLNESSSSSLSSPLAKDEEVLKWPRRRSKNPRVERRCSRRRRRCLGIEAVVLSCLFMMLLDVIPTTIGNLNKVADSSAVCSTSADGKVVCRQQERKQRLLKLEIAPTEEEKALCKDENQKCAFWASIGECDKNPKYMKNSCQKSCHTCVTGKGDPNKLVHFNSWGEPQEIVQGGTKDDYDYFAVYELLQETQQYMEEEIYKNPRHESYKNDCKNQHKLCTYWTSIGECEKNQKFMEKSCAPACKTCHALYDFDERCPRDSDDVLLEKSAWKRPGDLDAMFMNLLNDPRYEKYEPVLYSKPDYIDVESTTTPTSRIIRVTKGEQLDDDDDNDESEQPAIVKNQLGVPIVQNGPWVITLENFLTQDECDTLIALGEKQGYKRSTDVGEKKADGSYGSDVSEGRTSTNAWCVDACYHHETTKRVIEKLSGVTNMTDANAEYLQLLRYEETQFYQKHHDYIPHQQDRSEGPRILTLFVYLNDVEAGGGTDFPLLNLTVMPKRGKAVLWPSVLDNSPSEKDDRTANQALPVEKGIKYGANAWFHLRDFKEAHARGCTK